MRAATRKAIKLVRPQTPQTAHYLEFLLSEAETITAHERAASFWARDPQRVAIAWERLARTARDAALGEQRRTSAAKARWNGIAEPMAADLQLAREEMTNDGGLGSREAAALQRAGYYSELARRHAESGDFERAFTAAEMARTALAVVHEGYDSLHSRFDNPRLLRLWRRWVDDTVDESRTARAAVIVIDKLKRRLFLYRDGVRLGVFPAELGANGLRPKQHAGDRATPEGRYRVVQIKDESNTKYYRALLLNYPNAEDVARFRAARDRGQIPLRVGIGSLIEIHGDGGKGMDWTDGCVAVRNEDMDKLFRHVRVGTAVTIVGTF
ncbi:MAG: L,D-transpeptidase family protein [Acidobacteriota bacterium]